jgi:hypothetical protein
MIIPQQNLKSSAGHFTTEAEWNRRDRRYRNEIVRDRKTQKPLTAKVFSFAMDLVHRLSPY